MKSYKHIFFYSEKYFLTELTTSHCFCSRSIIERCHRTIGPRRHKCSLKIFYRNQTFLWISKMLNKFLMLTNCFSNYVYLKMCFNPRTNGKRQKCWHLWFQSRIHIDRVIFHNSIFLKGQWIRCWNIRYSIDAFFSLGVAITIYGF